VGDDTLEVIQKQQAVREAVIFLPGGREPLVFDL
jgi:hypothetical protein